MAKKPQIEKFREMARSLETDDSEEAFAGKLKTVATAKPSKDEDGERKRKAKRTEAKRGR